MKEKYQTAMDELEYLMDFNQSIILAMGKIMQHLPDFVFISMANITLARSFGIKQDTLNALRTATLHMALPK